jgi:hypothetical protein
VPLDIGTALSLPESTFLMIVELLNCMNDKAKGSKVTAMVMGPDNIPHFELTKEEILSRADARRRVIKA